MFVRGPSVYLRSNQQVNFSHINKHYCDILVRYDISIILTNVQKETSGLTEQEWKLYNKIKHNMFVFVLS